MRRGDETEFFEIRHDVANRRSAELESEIPGKCARAYRLAIADIVLHQQLQQLLSPLVQAFVIDLNRRGQGSLFDASAMDSNPRSAIVFAILPGGAMKLARPAAVSSNHPEPIWCCGGALSTW